jgi:hypothetical protein
MESVKIFRALSNEEKECKPSLGLGVNPACISRFFESFAGLNMFLDNFIGWMFG